LGHSNLVDLSLRVRKLFEWILRTHLINLKRKKDKLYTLRSDWHTFVICEGLRFGV